MSSRSSSPEIEGAVGGEDLDITNMSTGTTAKEPGTDPAMQTFFDNNRRDLMYELRQIRLGEKPVTGHSHRERINQFLSKRMDIQTQNQGKENVPANVDSVEEHRPEAVVVEVEGLYRQRCVSSLLRSPNFRRHLDGIIRRSMSSFTFTPRNSVSPQNSQHPSPAPSPQQLATPPRQQSPRQASPVSQNGAEANPALEILPAEDTHRPSPARIQPHIRSEVTDSQSRSSRTPELDRRPERQNVAEGNDAGQFRPIVVQDEVEALRLQRETIVDEISELVHRRLVSTTLAGDFRGTLEVHLEGRHDSTGADGDRVRNVIQSLPHDPLHQRNDFSHLGIPVEPDFVDIDNVSVTSISATAVPYTQTNLHLNRELQALKKQMEEMKNMLKMNMEIQLDIQRSIRQEVAAAVSQATAGQAASSYSDRPANPVNDTHCLICLESPADSVLYQCGHICVCYYCGKHLISQGATCPVCRAPIRDIIRAYKCNAE